MANPSSVVPYHDPYENSIEDEFLNFMTDPEPCPSLENLSPYLKPVPDTGDSLNDDPMIWSNIFYDNHVDQDSHQTGPSSRSWKGKEPMYTTNADDAIPVSVSVSPPVSVPFQCAGCQILREIIHTDVTGTFTRRLEIHGRLGLIFHAVLETKDNLMAIPAKPQYHMFDFSKKSMQYVKRFLQEYCDDKKKSGFVMVEDPFTDFYEALCVGLEFNQNSNTDDNDEPSPTNSGGNQRQTEQTERENETEKPKSLLALQRERAGKLKLKDLEQYFDLPIEEAAKRMSLCPTVVKKICRKFGLARWPHRKLKSLKRQVSNLKTTLNSNDAEEKERVEAEISKLEEEMVNICSVANT